MTGNLSKRMHLAGPSVTITGTINQAVLLVIINHQEALVIISHRALLTTKRIETTGLNVHLIMTARKNLSVTTNLNAPLVEVTIIMTVLKSLSKEKMEKIVLKGLSGMINQNALLTEEGKGKKDLNVLSTRKVATTKTVLRKRKLSMIY
jgi:hypothetical protein